MTTASVAPLPKVDYPESDGKPMAETDIHRQEMTDLIEALADHYRAAPDVYVAGNLLLYYEEGNPAASVAPDVFVVKGVGKGPRRTYNLWQEGRPPTAVIEVSSRSTRLEDLGNKRALYGMLGVAEYFVYDPLREYLEPPLQGFCLVGSDYQRLAADDEGAIPSPQLGLTFRLEGARLRLVETSTGRPLLRAAEAFDRVRGAEERVRRAEAEVSRLKAELAQLKGEGSS